MSGVTTAPTTVGTPIALTASSMTSRASGLRYGSRSEEFSGHSTKSGLATLPAFTSAASCSVRLGVVVEDRAALGVEVEPQARHVALDRGDGRGAVLGGVVDERQGGEAPRRPGRATVRQRGGRGAARQLAGAPVRGGPGGRSRTARSRTARRRSRAAACRRAPRAAGRRRPPGRRRSCPRGSRRTAPARGPPRPAIQTAAAHTGHAGQPGHRGDAHAGERRRTALPRRPAPATAPGRPPRPSRRAAAAGSRGR